MVNVVTVRGALYLHKYVMGTLMHIVLRYPDDAYPSAHIATRTINPSW